MSKIKIQGNASGTGVVTLTAPATSTDKTITLPDSTTTLVGSDTAVVKDASGNVGIGVTPESWNTYTALQVGGMGALFGYNASAGSDFSVANNVYYNSGYKRIFADEASVHQQINGTHVFQVAPSGAADSAISWTTAMTINNSGETIFGGASFGDNTTKIEPDGEVRIRRVSGVNKSMAVFYNGSSYVGEINTNTSSTTYATSSDYRLKENVTPMSGSIDRLKALKPSRFNFIADASKTVDGFLAHEAGEVVPECATGEKDAMKTEEYEVTPAVMDGETVVTEAVMGEREVPDMQGIDQSKLVPLLVGAIQELTARLEALEAN